MAASVSGLTQAFPFNNNTCTLATVGGANAAMPNLNSGLTQNGIDGSVVPEAPSNDSTSLTAGNHYSFWSGNFAASASYDISGSQAAMSVHFRNLSPGYTVIADTADAVWLILFSGSGTTNYGRWHFDGTPLKDGNWHVLTAQGTPDATGGTFDDTDVTGIGLAVESDTTGGVFGFQMAVDQCVVHEGKVIGEDTGGAATVDLLDYYDLLKATGGQTYHSNLVAIAGTTIEFGFPFDIQADDYDDTATPFSFGFRDGDGAGYPDMPSGFFSLDYTSQSAGDMDYGAKSIATLGTAPDWTVAAGTSSITLFPHLAANVLDVSLTGANLVCSGTTTILNADNLTIANGDLDLIVTDCVNAIQWTADLVAGSVISTNSDIDITFAETDLSDITLTLTASTTVTVSPTTGSGTYDLSGLTTTGTVTLDNDTANNTTITLAAGTTYVVASPTAGGGSVTVNTPAQTFTFTSDTAATLIRYFEDDSQAVVDSTTGTSLAYEFPDADPMDAEFVKQGYVPVNRQDIVPTDGGSLDIVMDFDEAYNSAHALTITTEYDYNRATKLLTINSDQNALDVRSSLADVIRTNSSYYNTPLLMVAIPGLARVDLTDGATITSMATWKRAGMERFDAADSLNPVEKWFCLLSLDNISGASVYYRQTSSGSATASSLTNNVVDEAFQYWSDPNHDGSTADGYDYSGYMVIKSFLAGSKEGRVDVVASSGLSALQSNLYTIGLTNPAGGYSGLDPGVTANITLVTGGVVGGETFAYEWVDGATTTAEDIANQIHYNKINIPNSVIAGGTGLTWWEIPDSVIFNGDNVETERGYEEGATPTLVGFYVSRSSSDHPGFARFQADNGNYYTPTDTVQYTAPNLLNDTRVRLYNVTAATEIDNSVVSGGGGYSYVLTPGVDFTSGDVITLLATYQSAGTAKEVFRNSATVTTADVTASDSQVDWDGPNVLAIDGSTVSECTTDYVQVQVEVNDADDTTQKSRIAAFIVDAITTADGIRNWVGLDGSAAISYFNGGAAQVDTDVANVEVINVKATSTLSVKDTFEFDWKDGVDRVDAVSGSSIIWLTPARVLLEETGVSGLTPTESSQLATISTVDSNVDILIQDQGLDASNPKTITENTPGESYDESFDTITKEIRKSGSTTTITRTA